MNQSCYILNVSNNIIGVFDNKRELNHIISECIKHNFFKKSDMNIMEFEINKLFGSLDLDNNIEIENQKNPILNQKAILQKITETNLIDVAKIIGCEYKEENEELKEIYQKKIDTQHEINLLKNQMKKMEEYKTQYEADLRLYHVFKKEAIDDNNFIIPELFTKKYSIFQKLENSESLNFENFRKEIDNHKEENNYSLFGSTTYDKKFEESNKPHHYEETFDM